VPPRIRARAGAVAAVALAAALAGTLAACEADVTDARGAAAQPATQDGTGTGGTADTTGGDGSAADAGGDERSDEGAAPGTPLPEYDVSSAVGDLADGFPSDLVSIPPGAQVLASSARASDDGSLVVITLNLRSDEPVDALTAYYTDVLGAQGFGVSPSSVPSALTSLTTFVRAADGAPTESVAVGVFDDESERLVTISGQVAPA